MKTIIMAGVLALGFAAARSAHAQPCFESQKITAPDAAADDLFGIALAMDGDVLVVGASGDDSTRGALYVYTWNGVTWVFGQKLIAPDAMDGDNLGIPVCIQGDTIVAGAFRANAPEIQSGAAYVFQRTGGVWTFAQKLAPSGLEEVDLFGSAIALDGNTLAIGAWQDDLSGGRVDAGSVYVFNRVGGVWELLQQVFAPDGEAGDMFGSSVDLDGTTLAVGAFVDDHPGAVNGGSVYVFTLQGVSWLFSRKIVPADVQADDYFGGPPDGLDLDGDTLLVGAGGDDDQGPCKGAAYLFQRIGVEWTQTTKIYATDPASSLDFGGRLRLIDGRAVIGAAASCNPANGAGTAHIFQETGGRWLEDSRLQASDAMPADHFGISVDFNDRFVAVGAFQDDLESPTRIDAGSVYVYRLVDCLGLPDCNGNLFDDRDDIVSGNATDINDNLIPDSCEGVCALMGDCDHNGVVNFADITCLLAHFNSSCP